MQKAIILKNIESAKITDKEFIKLLLKFERRLNTTINKIVNGMSWGSVCNEVSYWEASHILEKNFTNRGYLKKGKYYDLYCKYCKVTGTCPTSDISDYLA